MRYFIALSLITLSLFGQRLKVNSVNEVILVPQTQQDSVEVSIEDYQTKYRYSTIKIKSFDIKKEGLVYLSLAWLKQKNKSRSKYQDELLKDRLRDKDYNPSKLIDYVYEFDCINYEVLNLNTKAKIKDPLNNLENEPSVTYENSFIKQLHYIDTKEFCNGYVPKELILNTK